MIVDFMEMMSFRIRRESRKFIRTWDDVSKFLN